MEEHNYTIIMRGKALCHLDNVDTAREGLEYFGKPSYIKYNQPGIESYEDAKRWEEERDGKSNH